MFPWCGQDDRNKGHALDQVSLPRNVKTDGFGQQPTFFHPPMPVMPPPQGQGSFLPIFMAVPSSYLSGKIRKDPLDAYR